MKIKLLTTHPSRNTVNRQYMTINKRFSTTGIKTYRLSNATYNVSFDTIEEAKSFIENERNEHPRSKKFNPYIFDNQERRRIHYKDN